MGNFLKTILIIFILFVVLGFNFVGDFAKAKTTQEIMDKATKVDVACSKYNYPWCGDKPKGIADLVGKFYGYALAAVGVAALGAIVYGGILHTVSGGNASAQTEAKAWIWGAVSGVALLLGAYLLLNTINPELVKLKEPGIEPVKKIEKQYAGKLCADNSDCGSDYKCVGYIQGRTPGRCEQQATSGKLGKYQKCDPKNDQCDKSQNLTCTPSGYRGSEPKCL